MIVGETAAGTPAIDFTTEEYRAHPESEVPRNTRMTVAAFVPTYRLASWTCPILA